MKQEKRAKTGELSSEELLLYGRQMNLPGLGRAGQLRLRETGVLIAGTGGLGCAAAVYSAAAGIGRLGLCDYDTVEISNLHRQFLFSPEDQGRPKSPCAAQFLKRQNPLIEIESYTDCLRPENIDSVARDYDIILDCTDNFTTKFLLHEYAFSEKKDLVQSSLYQWEGQLMVFPFSRKEHRGCLRCLWPEVPGENCTLDCARAGILGAVAGVFGTFQALEALKLALRLPEERELKTFMMDFTDFSVRNIGFEPDPHCPLCGSSARALPPEELPPVVYDFPPDSVILDIRRAEDFEKNKDRYPASIPVRNIPYAEFKDSPALPDPEKVYTVVCYVGISSHEMMLSLREQGFKACSYFGGYERLRKESPPRPASSSR